MAEVSAKRASGSSMYTHNTPCLEYCEIPSSYKVSSAYYYGAMGLSMPAMAANQGESGKREPENAEVAQPFDTGMVQLELDLSEEPNA